MAIAVALVISRLFSGSIRRILDRIIQEDITDGWVRYIHFAIIVVGVANGVRIHALERYTMGSTQPLREGMQAPAIPELTLDRWVLEIYRTVIGTASGVAWLLLVFFVFALIAYVVVKIFEARGQRQESQEKAAAG